MAGIEPRYTKEEFARRGDEIFERVVRPRVEGEDERKFVVIDIETEDFEVDADEISASDRLRARNPDGQFWARRVGSRYVYSFGGSQFRRSAGN
jgi:hypothetical protein